MEGKTYYMILGVSSAESPTGIRAAYRDLAKRLHPDVSGGETTGAFQEVAEAYRILSDPQLRRDYNNKLTRGADGDVGPRRRRPPEPLVREPLTILGHPETIRPSFEALYDQGEKLEGLNFEILLSPEESVHGCTVPVRVPVFLCCPECGGSGRDWVFPCAFCQQQGIVESEQTVRIRIPPMSPPGSVIEIPLQGLGIQNLYLRLHMFIDAAP